jgi:preprotein translocase subunit SecG
MYYALFAIHVVLSLMLCVVVLLQQSKGGGLAGAFGGAGAGEAMFGARGVTTMLHKATIYLAIAFMITSLGLVFATARRGGGTSGDSLSRQAAQRIPVTPAPIPVEGGGDEGMLPIAPGGEEGAAGASSDSTAPDATGAAETQQGPEDGASQSETDAGQQSQGGGQ